MAIPVFLVPTGELSLGNQLIGKPLEGLHIDKIRVMGYLLTSVYDDLLLQGPLKSPIINKDKRT